MMHSLHYPVIARDIFPRQPINHPIPYPPLETHATRVDLTSKHKQPLPAGLDHIIARVQPQVKLLLNKCFYRVPPLHNALLFSTKQNKIVTVPEVLQRFYRMQDIPIKFMKVNIRKDLAREIADRDAKPQNIRQLSLSLSTFG